MQGFFQIANFHIPREPVSSESGESAPVDYIVVSRRSRGNHLIQAITFLIIFLSINLVF